MSDSTATAREKYHCPACGAEARWTPAKHALVCPFCGTQSPAELKTRGDVTVIVEHDLVTALREIPDSARGWNASKTSVRCQSCRAISVMDPVTVGHRCAFCGSSQLVPYEQVTDDFRPESLLPLKVSEPQARELIRIWYRRQWLAPNALRALALVDTAKGAYLPYWTFDASAVARWRAETGDYYTVRQNGKTVRKIRWRPAAGELTHAFDDELVCASHGVHAAMLRRVEPFPTADVIPYDPGYLAGWTVERYQIDLITAAVQSRRQMDATLRRLCAAQVPGDTHRHLVVDTTYTDQRFKHILVPVWLLTYRFGVKSYQVAVNGVTGRIAGERPWSRVKIGLLALSALIILFLITAYG